MNARQQGEWGLVGGKGAGWGHKDVGGGVATLLRRRAEQADGQADVVGDLGCRDRRTHTDRRNNVVAAGVADGGQAVVFRAKGDVQRAPAGARAKAGREVTDAATDAET